MTETRKRSETFGDNLKLKTILKLGNSLKLRNSLKLGNSLKHQRHYIKKD